MYLTKNEILYSIYISSFEQIKKNSNSKDQKYSTISEICKKLNESKNILDDFHHLQKMSLILVDPLENYTNKTIDIILIAIEQIIKDELINKSILQKMIEPLLNNLMNYLDKNEANPKLNQKILNVCELIYSNNFLFIHNNNFKNILEICIKIYLLETENNHVYKSFILFINKMISNTIPNKISTESNNEYIINCIHNKESSKKLLDKNECKRNAQLNSFNFFNKLYIDFLIDIIEIQLNLSSDEEDENENENLINKYINIITKMNKSSIQDQDNKQKNNINSFKEELESLNLMKLNLHYIKTEGKITGDKIGKYGWCILCRKTSNYWSNSLNFPICDSNNSCEKELINFLSNLYSKNDYINMLLFLSKNSVYYINSSNENQKNKLIKEKETDLCLRAIKEMLIKGVVNFKNDADVIIIIREIFNECILKNALSKNIKIVQLSLELFKIIFKHYRYYLKENIELFFRKVFINFLESEDRGFNFKEIAIDNLSSLLDISNFLIEIYVNYDLDSNSMAIFCVIINLFTKIMNGLYLNKKYQNTFKNAQENSILVDKTFNFLNKFISNLNGVIEKNLINEKQIFFSVPMADSSNIDIETILKENKIGDIIDKSIDVFNNGKTIDECLSFLQNYKIIVSEDSFNKMKNIYINDYNNNTMKKNYLSILSDEENRTINELKKYYLSLYNEKEDKTDIESFFGSNFNHLLFFITNVKKEELQDIIYNSYVAFEMAYYIRLNIRALSIAKLGNYLFYDNPINDKILHYFIFSFDFKDKNIFESMKILFSQIPEISDEKIVNKIILIFGQKFFEDNPNAFDNIDYCYYIAFSLIHLNDELYHNDNKQNISFNYFVQNINSIISENHNINIKYLENIYNQILKEPLTFFNDENKLKSKLDKNHYVTNIENSSIKKLVNFSCNNLSSIYFQLLNESIIKNKKDLFLICIEKILNISKICGMLKIDSAQEAYTNMILSLINLNERDELSDIMIELILKLMTYINDNCQYIRKSWMQILLLISKLEYYLLEPEETIINNMRSNKATKFSEKDIKLFLKKRSTLSINISDAVCEAIFSKTELLDNTSIVNFISDLCEVSKQELNSFLTPRFFSLNKLIAITEFNIQRIQFHWNKIWKIISEYLIELICNYPKENLWKFTLDSLKLIVGKIISNQKFSIYNFQMELFRPFEIIFNKTSRIPERGELVIDSINYLVMKFSKDIYSGWIIIFRLLRIAFQRKSSKINENIKNILQFLYEKIDILLNNNFIIFREYIECLSFLYIDKSMKQFAFNIIVDILSKIVNNEKNAQNIMKTPNSNKIFEYIRIFFYSIDDLIAINVFEYFRLLFEIINHNKKIFFSEELNIFLYIYFSYFKLYIATILLSNYDNRFSLIDYKEEDENKNIVYKHLTGDNIPKNIIEYLQKSLDNLINDFISEESKEYSYIFNGKDNIKEQKLKIIGLMKEIKDQYISNKTYNYLNVKISQYINLDKSNYELSIKYFLEKFKNIYCESDNSNNSTYKYNYFFIDLILSIIQLSILNSKSDLIYKTVLNIISSSIKEINQPPEKIMNNNIFILRIISFSKLTLKSETDIYKFIKYAFDYSNYILEFIKLIPNGLVDIYKLVSKLLNKILLIDINNNSIEKYKIFNSNLTIELLSKLQEIQIFILSTNTNNLKEIKNTDDINALINLNKIYDKYQIAKLENSLINKIYINEMENILPKFINYYHNKDIEIIYECVTNFIGSANHNIRKSAKTLLKSFVQIKLINLNNKHVN